RRRPTPIATCAAPSTAPASTSSRRRSSRRCSPSRAARSSPSGVPSSPDGGGRAWCALAAVLAVGAALAFGRESTAFDWQPSLALAQPWRAFSAAFIHYSALHLSANLAGAVLVGALGFFARVPSPVALAWLVAWPLTQLGLL